MATETTKKKATSKSAVQQVENPPTENEGNGNGSPAAVVNETENARKEQEKQLEVLEPKGDPKRWVIGKPPEEGGKPDEFSIYIQKPLGYMSRMRFFSLVSRTIAEAIKSGGTVAFGGSDMFSSGGNFRERAAALTSDDFADAGSFMALAMQLVSYAPDFLLECYCLWLDVPATERTWAKMVMNQSRDPQRNQWGLTEDEHLELVEIFIDQNYDDIREFFSGKLPALVQRVREREAQRKAADPESASDQ